MASEVDIANLALAHIGDRATISSLNPPEGSAQAEHCARFYTMARNALLEMHTWNFSTTRANGEEVDSTTTSWQYAYSKPNNCLKIISVLPPNTTDDYSAQSITGIVTLADGSLQSPAMFNALYQSQPYAVEIDSDGSEIILTNQAEAVIRYVVKVTDTTKFSNLFVLACARLLSSYLAGPVLKGDVGRAEAKSQYQMFLLEFSQAVSADSNQRNVKPRQSVPWLSGRA